MDIRKAAEITEQSNAVTDLDDELRLYVFSHAWLSSIQKGIQGTHATVELMKMNFDIDNKKQMLLNWANNHKTIISLNGGDSRHLTELYFHFINSPYPCADFREDGDSLESARTAVSCVLPKRIYEGAAITRSKEYYFEYSTEKNAHILKRTDDYNTPDEYINWTYTEHDITLMYILGGSRLAS